MEQGRPSRTAFAAAMHRAAHQVLDGGAIFTDPLALPIIGEDAASITRWANERPAGRRMRMFIAVRTRVAEDSLALAVKQGVRQLVVLSAGLDTFAYRSPYGGRLRVFEVDHPDTQTWKRRHLAQAGIPLPPWLTFAPLDFERQDLKEGLAAAGFEPAQPCFFTWLGVVPYLTEQAVWSTLRFLANLPGGAEVVFDYGNPPDSLSPELRASHDRRAARVVELGEAFVTYFDTAALRSGLINLGFSEVEDLGPRQIVSRYFPGATGPDRDTGGHILRAATPLSLA